MAISAIRELRALEKGDPELPLARRAYIIRQFKRPEEIKLLRSVYGRQFIQISANAPEQFRVSRIAVEEMESKQGLSSEVDARNAAYALVKQDENETLEGYGQNVRDAFPLADVVIEASDRESCRNTLTRFVHALFGDNSTSPTHDEYGMYMAKSASLRTSALTRQVGAAIFRQSGEIISLGSNEVPKAGGGTYWSGDKPDARDFVIGNDPNDQKKSEIFVDLINRLLDCGHLSKSLAALKDPRKIADVIRSEGGASSIKESKVMDLLEFGRDIHAESVFEKGIPSVALA